MSIFPSFLACDMQFNQTNFSLKGRGGEGGAEHENIGCLWLFSLKYVSHLRFYFPFMMQYFRIYTKLIVSTPYAPSIVTRFYSQSQELNVTTVSCNDTRQMCSKLTLRKIAI